jgi:hypothetical protein
LWAGGEPPRPGRTPVRLIQARHAAQLGTCDVAHAELRGSFITGTSMGMPKRRRPRKRQGSVHPIPSDSTLTVCSLYALQPWQPQTRLPVIRLPWRACLLAADAVHRLREAASRRVAGYASGRAGWRCWDRGRGGREKVDGAGQSPADMI